MSVFSTLELSLLNSRLEHDSRSERGLAKFATSMRRAWQSMKPMFRWPIRVATLALLVLSAACVAGDGLTSQVSVREDVSGANTIVVEQGNGDMEIVGDQDEDEIQVTLFADSELPEDALSVSREGSRLVVIQQQSVEDSSRLLIEVPSSLVADVIDGGGPTHIEGLSGLLYLDASGTTAIRNIDGDVEIRDGSGTLTVSDVVGRVHIVEDTSGAIEVSSVSGGLVIDEDSSGPLDIRDIAGTVEIGHTAADTVQVARVGGDLLVDRHDSAEFNLDEIKGRVEIPGY